ncbi:16S rRNA (cytosine(1402)-N(4))-methyltransferase RsmH [Myxococcota bacterium]|nr:16S rRNA (cytosine(1402)-N(4))-methyltransferase RsmH [Myxococcota bacterium]
MTYHVPVMVREVLDALRVRPDGRYLDGTAGGGGHAEAIAARLSERGRLVALDRDEEAVAAAAARLAPYGDRVVLAKSAFSRMEEVVRDLGLGTGSFDGVLLDLGVSSRQVDDPLRGFSFQKEGPLDMRMDRGQPTTARDLVNGAEERELAAIFRDLGDEPRAARIAREIVRRRAEGPIETTTDLVKAVEAAVGPRGARSHHPATRVFQALRIAVNREVEELNEGLGAAFRLLAPGGRLAVIAFHSGEDRAVKRFMRDREGRCACPPEVPICVCGRKPELREVRRGGVTAGEDEVRANPRARSARLRIAERIPG